MGKKTVQNITLGLLPQILVFFTPVVVIEASTNKHFIPNFSCWHPIQWGG